MEDKTDYDAVVMFSGGAGSWMAARRAAATFGADRIALLFADTQMEDPDLHRFLDDAAADIGAPLIKIADGRDIWQVFRDRRLLGNSRIATCSHELKQRPARRWMDENAPGAVVVLGIDWSEQHRLPAARRGWAPFEVIAPMCDAPHLTRRQVLQAMEERGIEIPRLYRMGFAHNNCGGGCVRAGMAQFAHLYRTMPDRYDEWAKGEESIRALLGADVAILRSRAGGRITPVPLAAMRDALDRQPAMFDPEDWGGCGCFVSEDSAEDEGMVPA